MDFYAVLGLGRDAQADAIAGAYRRSALATNPECNQDHPDPSALAKKFKQVSQAYVVLSDPHVRAIYDQYGEDGVRHGGTGNIGRPGGVDIDAVDPFLTFRRFFGVDSPFQVLGNMSGVQNNQHGFFSISAAKDKNPPKADPVRVTLPVTIEDVFHGNLRRVDWEVKHYTTRNEVTSSTMAFFEVAVPKGIRAGDQITLLGKGDTKDACSKGDVIVTFEMAPHQTYTRSVNDLVINIPITLEDALCGVKFTVPTLEGRTLPVQLDEVVTPSFRRVIKGEGLPLFGNPTVRGDLIVLCPTIFPRYLSAEQKIEIRRILNSGDDQEDKKKEENEENKL